MAPLGVAPYILGMASLVYGVVAGGLGALFVLLAVRLYRSADDRQAWSLFKFSLIYLTVLFAGLILDKLFVQQLGLVAGLGL